MFRSCFHNIFSVHTVFTTDISRFVVLIFPFTRLGVQFPQSLLSWLKNDVRCELGRQFATLLCSLISVIGVQLDQLDILSFRLFFFTRNFSSINVSTPPPRSIARLLLRSIARLLLRSNTLSFAAGYCSHGNRKAHPFTALSIHNIEISRF